MTFRIDSYCFRLPPLLLSPHPPLHTTLLSIHLSIPPPHLYLQFPSQAGVQVLLVNLAHLVVPAVVCQQCQVPSWDGTHLHGTSRPLYSIQVIEAIVEDKGRGPPVGRSIGRVSEPPGLRDRVPGKEHAMKLLLRKRLMRQNLPHLAVACRGAGVAWRDVYRVDGAQAVDDGALGVCGKNVWHPKLGGLLSGTQEGHIQKAMDQGRDSLVVAPWVMRRDGRRETCKGDVRLFLMKRRGYDHNVIERVAGGRISNVVYLVKTACWAWGQ